MDISEFKDKLEPTQYAKLETEINTLIAQRDAIRKSEAEYKANTQKQISELTEAQKTILDKLGIASITDLDKLPDAKGQAEAAKQFESKLKRLENDLIARNNAFDEIKNKYQLAQQHTALTKAMSGYDFIDADLITSYVMQRLSQDDSGAIQYKTDNGTTVSIEEGLALLTKAKPSLLKATSPSGSGYRSGNGGGDVGHNPWLKKTWNFTEQVRLATENPNLAIQLKKAANSVNQ